MVVVEIVVGWERFPTQTFGGNLSSDHTLPSGGAILVVVWLSAGDDDVGRHRSHYDHTCRSPVPDETTLVDEVGEDG